MLDSMIQSRQCTIYVNQPHNNDVTSKTSLVSRLAYRCSVRYLSTPPADHRHRRRTILAATVLGFLSHSAYNPDHSGPLSILKVKGSVYRHVSSTC